MTLLRFLRDECADHGVESPIRLRPTGERVTAEAANTW